MSPAPSASSAPLVVRFGAFGDMILLIPVLKLLAARYGRPCDVVSSGGWTTPLLDRVPASAQRFLLTSRRAPYWFNRSQRRLVAWLRARPPGPVYVVEPDEKPLSLLRRARIDPAWICTLRDFPREPREHILAQTLRLARATPTLCAEPSNPIGYPPTSSRPASGNLLGYSSPADPASLLTPDTRPTLSDTDHRDCADWLARHQLAAAPVVLIQPGNKKTMKRGDRRRSSNVDYWPEENWARVITGVLAALPAARVVICGAPSERMIADDIVALLSQPSHSRVVVGSNELPIPRLLALQARAHSMISVNTGPAHSAAAMGCPLAALFTRHPHRAADFYAPVPTTAPVKIIQPDAALGLDAELHALPPDSVVAAWRTLVSV